MGFALAAGNRQSTPVASINTTPLVDVMLVLLIIFMIAAPLFTHKVPFAVPVGVPPDKVVAPPPEQTLAMVPNGGGVLYLLDGEVLAGAALPSALRRIAKAREETRLNLVVDPGVAYADVATVLALARQSGVEKMGFEDLKGVTKR